MSGRGAFLDCRKLPDFAAQFPTVFAACQSAGIDPRREPIPVAPAAHYHMGGVFTDRNARTTVEGLWACGEVAATGAHGANRLASNSLLEAVVFGARAAKDIAATVRAAEPPALAAEPEPVAAPAIEPDSAAVTTLRQAMTAKVGVIRDEASLRDALGVIAGLERGASSDRQLANMLTTAKLITAAALARRESRGAHFRSDYPAPDPELAERSMLTLTEADAIAAAAIKRRGRAPRRSMPLHA